MTSRDLFFKGLSEFGASPDGYGRASVNIAIDGRDEMEVRIYIRYDEVVTKIYCPLGEYDTKFVEKFAEDMVYGVAKIGRMLVMATSIPTPELSFQIVDDTIIDMASLASLYLDNPELQNPWPAKPVLQS